MSLRVAVIGVGHLGRHHARILSSLPGVRLVAVVDTNRARAQEIARTVNAEALFRCALARKESRGAHARSDYPHPDPHLGQVNMVVRRSEGGMAVRAVESEPVPYDLTEIISQSFQKYTPEELS